MPCAEPFSLASSFGRETRKMTERGKEKDPGAVDQTGAIRSTPVFRNAGGLAWGEQRLAYLLPAPPCVIVSALILFPVFWNLWPAFHWVRLMDLRSVPWGKLDATRQNFVKVLTHCDSHEPARHDQCGPLHLYDRMERIPVRYCFPYVKNEYLIVAHIWYKNCYKS